MSRLAWLLWTHGLRAISRHFEPRSTPTPAGWVICPDCDQEIPIGISDLRIYSDENGQQYVSADLQTEDVWAHAWTHET